MALKPIPRAAALRDKLMSSRGNMVEICGGEGSRTSFQITATHYDRHWLHGGDYGWAYLDGYIGEATPADVR